MNFLLSSLAVDTNGLYRLLDDTLLDCRYVNVEVSRFYNPDIDYTGFAADGYWYTAGVPDPTHTPYQASWASEAAGAHRGPRGDFPPRVFVITTPAEVTILDADTLDVFIRFTLKSTASSGTGTFLGDNSTDLKQASFMNGWLAVATDEGLRIASFTDDTGFIYLESAAAKAEVGLSGRNTDLYLDDTSIAGATHRILVDSCLSVDVNMRSEVASGLTQNRTLCAVGHAQGLTGIQLDGPAAPTYPYSLKHSFTLVKSVPCYFVDDGSSGSSNQFTDYVSGTSTTNWSGEGVLPGDELYVNSTLYTITEVALDYLVLDGTGSSGAAYAAYGIRRPANQVKIGPAGTLFILGGSQQITYVSNTDWFEGSAIDIFSRPYATCTLVPGPQYVYSLDVSGLQAIVSADTGVYVATETEFAASSDVALQYGIIGSEATYPILPVTATGFSFACNDPESGNTLIATQGENCVYEIDPYLHKILTTTETGSPIRSIVAYHNPSGPPAITVEG